MHVLKRRKIKQTNAVKLEVNPKENAVELFYLKPYTQYAIYVQANMIAPQNPRKPIVARSPIMFERTYPDGKKPNCIFISITHDNFT